MQYTLKRSQRARRVSIKILPQGVVQVSAPPQIPAATIAQFVESQTIWIETQLKKQQQETQKLSLDNQVYVFGKQYAYVLKAETKVKTGIRIVGTNLVNNVLSLTDSAAASKSLNRWLKATAEKYLVPRTHQLAKLMNQTLTSITLREQASRWGSCSSRGTLNFNWRLVHYPLPVIDYVIVHELAHREHMNHSTQFWQLVEKFDPEYRLHRGYLKRHRRIWQ